MIYLDNSASSLFKPSCVAKAICNTITMIPANPGRSGHTLALRGSRLVTRARAVLGKIFNQCNIDRVVFNSGATAGLNMAIFGTTQRGHVITTVYEHNSVLRPLYSLKNSNIIDLSIALPDENGEITAAAIERLIRRDTYMIVVNHVSNVTGAVAPITDIGRLARDRNLLFVCDAAQSAGHMPIDIVESCIDILAVPAHKGLHGPQGVGCLIASDRAHIVPTILGGTGVASENVVQPSELPEGLESGTLPLPAISGMLRGADWSHRNMAQNKARIALLSNRLLQGLYSMDSVKVFTDINSTTGVIGFNILGLSSSEVSSILSEQYDIATRSGLHCAPLIHKYLGTIKCGMVRASIGCDNTLDEIDFVLTAVREIAQK